MRGETADQLSGVFDRRGRQILAGHDAMRHQPRRPQGLWWQQEEVNVYIRRRTASTQFVVVAADSFSQNSRGTIEQSDPTS